MIMFSKCISEAMSGYELGHVLILMLVIVFVRVQPITLTPNTGCSLMWILTKTSYADSMARSTDYSLDKYIPAAVTDEDTIITR
jgi:hypothetical protein